MSIHEIRFESDEPFRIFRNPLVRYQNDLSRKYNYVELSDK